MPADPPAPGGRLAATTARFGVPMLLLALVLIEIRGGEAALPTWLGGVAVRLALADEAMLRILIGVQIGLGGAILLFARWSRAISVATLTLLAFAAIAELSALLGRDVETSRYAPPAILLAIAGAALPGLLKSGRATTPPRGSVAWGVLGTVIVATASIGFAARLPLPKAPSSDPTSFTGEVVDLAPDTWVGKTIPGSGLAARLPQLTALTLEGRTAVVFYNPRCGSCHELFDEWFAEGAPCRVVAVEIPPEAGAVVLESDLPAEVSCPNCPRLELPGGPLYLIQPPVVAAVEDGVITCVALQPEEVANCIGGWFGRPPATASGASSPDGAG